MAAPAEVLGEKYVANYRNGLAFRVDFRGGSGRRALYHPRASRSAQAQLSFGVER
jgi:hypothetical protein